MLFICVIGIFAFLIPLSICNLLSLVFLRRHRCIPMFFMCFYSFVPNRQAGPSRRPPPRGDTGGTQANTAASPPQPCPHLAAA